MCERILRALRYVHGEFDDPEGYERLAAALDELDGTGSRGNRIFYLATPPSQFAVIVKQLGDAGLARRGAYDGATRAATATARAGRAWSSRSRSAATWSRRARSTAVIGRVFDERQVYRIDHYLGKETVQNILVFRFANGIFEPLWNRRYVDHVQITVAETLGVERPRRVLRGGRRAARHGPEPPAPAAHAGRHGAAGRVRRRRGARREGEGAARDPAHPAATSVSALAVRGQYVRGRDRRRAGARLPPGASAWRRTPRRRPTRRSSSRSTTGAGQGVPFYLRTGKRLPRRVTEIAIHFKRPPLLLFQDAMAGGGLQPNVLVLRIQPDEGISLQLRVQAAGPRGRAAAGGHGLQLRHHPPRAARSAPTRRCCSTPWRAT